MTMVTFILYHQERSNSYPTDLIFCKLIDLDCSRPDIWMGKRNFGYQVYEPAEETQGDPDYGEFYHYLKKRNGMSLASFFLPEDLDDIFVRTPQDVDVLAVPDL